MARHHELAGDVKQAIHFYTRAGAYNNVIRICKEHGFEDQLFNVALLRKRSKHRNFYFTLMKFFIFSQQGNIVLFSIFFVYFDVKIMQYFVVFY